VRQQLGNDEDDDEDHAPNGRMPPPQLSIVETIRAIHEESGFAGLFAGLPQTVPLALLPAMTMYMHALLLRSLPVRMRANPPGAATLVFGALSNALTALVLYPLVFAKALSQAGADKGKTKYSGGMIGMMRYIAQRDGWSGLYRGFQAYRIKGAVQQGVTMLIKQR
jgi:adenine nucleotide transporter 17